MLVDSHCHLTYPGLRDDIGGVLDRARHAGVERFLTISTRVSEFDEILAVANAHDDVYCSVGVHPHEAAAESDVDLDMLCARANNPKVVAIGETGLDYFYEHSPRDIQQRLFRTHIAAARETGLPLVVHTRDADADTCAILQEEMEKGGFSGVIHCFSTGWDLARQAMELGFYISISGIVTFKKSDDLRCSVRKIPLDRLLVETDAPFLAPVPYRGKTNEPAFVTHTAAVVADLKGVSPEELSRVTTRNFYNLFTKAGTPVL